MLFTSLPFIIFFLVFFVFYLIIPREYRTYLIIIGSTFFYGWWSIEYTLLPYFMTFIAYLGALWINRCDGFFSRKQKVCITLFSLFVPLIFFKYTDFIVVDVFGSLLDVDKKPVDLALPLGVSFVTFTLTAYVIDTYKGRFHVVRSPSTLLAHVLFFPHLIAGPILRPIELIPQLLHPRRATTFRFVVPLAIFTLGLVKKVIFADQIGLAVDQVYMQDGISSAFDALIAIYGFSVQIYCDFSGYTDMAIGLALAMGVRFPNNFSRPYASTSLVEFWRHWHITLSYWLRDYLYKPLGGNRHGNFNKFRNIMVTMVLGGLWHGASWNFVIWGGIHGAGVSLNHIIGATFRRKSIQLPDWLLVILTFHFVTIAWVFFRASTVDKAIEILVAPLTGSWLGLAEFLSNNAFVLVLICIFFLFHRFDDNRKIKIQVRRASRVYVLPLIVFAWVLAVAVSQGSSAAFIYFEF